MEKYTIELTGMEMAVLQDAVTNQRNYKLPACAILIDILLKSACDSILRKAEKALKGESGNGNS